MRNQTGLARAPLLATVAVLLVAGAGIYLLQNRNNEAPVSRESNETSSNLAETLPSDLLPLEQVRGLASSEVPNVDIASVELEREDGVLLYKVKLANGNILFFNAQNGVKVVRDDNDDELEDGVIPADFTAGIGFDRAREIALQQKAGGTVRKIELEHEDGRVVYSVRFTDDARIDVDATTGDVVRTEPSNSADDNSGRGSNDDSNDDSGNSGSSNSGSGSSGGNSGSGSSGSGSDDSN